MTDSVETNSCNVVGTGISGLAAARELQAAAGLAAADRLIGRLEE